MSIVPVMALFAFAAVVNSVIFGIAFLWRGRVSHLRWLGLMFLCIGFLLAVYTLERYDRVWIGGWLRVAYDVVSLLLSCFLLEFVVGGLLGRRPRIAIYGSIIVYLVALAVFRGGFLEWFSIGRLVFVQFLYTVAALYVCALSDDAPWKSGRWKRTWYHVFAVPVVFVLVHTAHLLRTFMGGRWSRDPAPIVGIVALIGMTAYAITSVRLAGWFSPRPRIGAGRRLELLDRVDRAMTERRLFVQPHLDLGALARAVGSTPQNLSAALNAELGKTFYEYVTAYRVREAERLLRDPENHNLSLEAVGEESGFKSRSNFYSAFKKSTGKTPGEYRSSPAG